MCNPDHSLTDVVAGRDPLDSTSVADPYTPFELPDDISLSGVHVGIPKVSSTVIIATPQFSNVIVIN